MLNRRHVLIGASALAPLALLGCAGLGKGGGVTLDQVKLYEADLVGAVSAAAAAFLAGTPAPSASNAALVNNIVADLHTLDGALQGVVDVSSAKATVTSILEAVNKLVPIVSQFLGAAAPYVPLAIAVLEAFVQSLPLPPAAPATPPAALHRAALTYRH